MKFSMLLPQFPHAQESRVHSDALLELQARESYRGSHHLAALWQRLKTLVS
ncbi:hypothetical protein [Paraburkholderia susongensis]|uniref:Uncharacterized protein n=1 Tax=Paraburkholderia susongensis TaxID=1515439 RepID=A0A1X7LK17_9BURK|nr:hypothetical protein [Paraburkholderia susongensis]SMG53673.1 hypothetical protein SAMN06265784_106205 [Paraburkholderia susongensis]